MLVSDLMTRNIRALNQNAGIDEALALIEELFIRHVPVVDDSGLLVGLVTQRDLLAFEHKKLPNGPLKDLMRANPVTARPSQTLRSAAETMIVNKYGCLPVVDENGALAGIITETDFLKLAIFPLAKKGEAKA